MTSPDPAPATVQVDLVVEQLWQPVPGGSGTYISALAGALSTRADVRLTARHARHATAGSPVDLPQVPMSASLLPRTLLYAAWSRARFTERLPLRGSRSGPRVLHATTWAIPPRRHPLVVTVHDLAFEHDPTHFTPHGVAYFRRAMAIARRSADAVVVPSAATRDDCLAAGFDADRIHVVPHGVTVPVTTAADVAAFRSRYGLDRDLLLWCGTLEPRKNLRTVIAAFEQLLRDGSDLDLVIVGPDGWGATADDTRRAMARLPEGRVHRLGRLPWRDLHAAYAAATVFCFPSLWEGFGMPVLEAMAHGTPVVTSAGTSMAEFGGTGTLLVDGRDPAQVAEAVARAAGPEHARLSAGALLAAAEHTWERSAAQHVTAYRAAARHA